MTCEVCGHEIFGKPFKTMIGRAKMIVCRECAELGSVSWEEQPKRQRGVGKPLNLPRRVPRVKPSAPPLSAELELVKNYGSLIRKARREAGLSHEDLGRKVREKISVLRKIETRRMIPDHLLTQKLEHALQVKLLVPASEPRVSRAHLSKPHKPTLGDIIRLKKEAPEETKKREQS